MKSELLQYQEILLEIAKKFKESGLEPESPEKLQKVYDKYQAKRKDYHKKNVDMKAKLFKSKKTAIENEPDEISHNKLTKQAIEKMNERVINDEDYQTHVDYQKENDFYTKRLKHFDLGKMVSAVNGTIDQFLAAPTETEQASRDLSARQLDALNLKQLYIKEGHSLSFNGNRLIFQEDSNSSELHLYSIREDYQ